MHSKATTNKRRLKARKAKDKKGNLVTKRQRNTITKAKLDCRFKYILSYKLISFNSKKKKYIKTLKYFKYIYLIYLNLFLFKIYKTKMFKY